VKVLPITDDKYPQGRMNDIGKFLVVAGLLITLAGILLWSGFGKGWFGRLPGDIHYSKGDFHFYFPIVTCLILSLLLTLILWLFRR
jgi:membrane protein implicated in regulation of membrane protease activity